MRHAWPCVRRSLSPPILGSLRRSALVLLGLLALLVAPPPSAAVNIDWVQVGNPGNAPDPANGGGNCGGRPNCGQVDNTYYISKNDTTNAQYAEFLNAVDPGGGNTLGLWNTSMQTDTSNGGISFVSGNALGSKYVVNSGFANDPVGYVSFYSAMRFANWLDNGQGSGSTETGAYTLLGGTPSPTNGFTVMRNMGATIFVPSENEWYKAAYYDPISGTYFNYSTGTNTPPVCAAPGATPNTANCKVGHVTPVGAYTGSPSPYGTFDQGGNVAQYNDTGGALRGERGGNFSSNNGQFISAASPVTNGAPTDMEAGIGFRVASLVPEPDTGLLVMTGLVGFAARARRQRV